MAEIKLVTQNDEPALALGEYLLSEDGETLYVGSAGVESGSSEIIYRGISPVKVKSGIISRLATISEKITAKPNNIQVNSITNKLIRNLPITIRIKPQNILLREEFNDNVN